MEDFELERTKIQTCIRQLERNQRFNRVMLATSLPLLGLSLLLLYLWFPWGVWIGILIQLLALGAGVWYNHKRLIPKTRSLCDDDD